MTSVPEDSLLQNPDPVNVLYVAQGKRVNADVVKLRIFKNFFEMRSHCVSLAGLELVLSVGIKCVSHSA